MRYIHAAALSLVFCGASLPTAAQDAPFGCKVLLCAAASNPSWSGIPYCVPVMQELFSILARGGSWPTCPMANANASSVHSEPYLACPEGQTAVTSAGSSDGGETRYKASKNGAKCAYPTRVADERDCPEARAIGIDPHHSYCVSLSKREENPTPYYVDIDPGTGTTSRFWFSSPVRIPTRDDP